LALIDLKNTFGFVVAALFIIKGVEMAEPYRIGAVAVKHSSHYGMAATYLLGALKMSCVAIVSTNTSRNMPRGTKEPLSGTSPFAVAVPDGEVANFVFDISPSAAAGDKI
jgi:LDH2 family malate/lactate/ureidoglycolate dehydrogenase